MIIKTVYISDDGVWFDTESKCISYEENVLNPLKEILKLLNPQQHESAIRQDEGKVKKAFNDFMDLCAKVIPSDEMMFKKAKEGNVHISHVEYVLNEWHNDFPSLNDTMFRFSCISHKTWIEYPQPYYVEHEKEFKGNII